MRQPKNDPDGQGDVHWLRWMADWLEWNAGQARRLKGPTAEQLAEFVADHNYWARTLREMADAREVGETAAAPTVGADIEETVR